jgi:hypothetical protein
MLLASSQSKPSHWMSPVAFTRAVSVKTRTWTSDLCCATATTSSPPDSPELSLCGDFRVGRVTCGLVVAVSGDVEDDEGEVGGDRRADDIRKEVLEERFAEYLESVSLNADIIPLLEAVVRDESSERTTARTDARDRIERRVSHLKAQRDQLVREFVYAE